MTLFLGAAARLLAMSTLATAANAQMGGQGSTPGQGDGMMGDDWGWGMGNGMGGFGGTGILVLALVVIAIAVLTFRGRRP